MEYFKPKPAEEFKFEDIKYEKRDGIAFISFNRPQVHNTYSTKALLEMCQAFKDASWDDSIGVIVMTGAGDRAFCTGGDVREYAGNFIDQPREFWKWGGLFMETINNLRNTGKPTIARINGMAVGGGNEFHIACDLSIAVEHATFFQVGTRVGSVPCGGATQFLPILVGDRRARELLYLCEPIDAMTAKEWGMVNKVVPSLVDENGEFISDPQKRASALKNLRNAKISLKALDEAIEDMAKKLLNKFPECMRYTIQQTNFWKDLSWMATFGHGRDWLSIHFNSPEAYEGMTSFVEKRPTDYMKLRNLAAEGKSSEYLWGPPSKTCKSCGVKGIPFEFDFCGKCGARIN